MKKKFKLQTKIGQKVHIIEIGIRADCDKHHSTNLYPDGVSINESKIVYQTFYKIALNTKWITLLERQKVDSKKESYNTYLEDSIVSIKTKESYFPNGIFGTIYTIGDTDKAIKKLTSDMQKKVNKEYGFMFNIDIASVVDEYLSKV